MFVTGSVELVETQHSNWITSLFTCDVISARLQLHHLKREMTSYNFENSIQKLLGGFLTVVRKVKEIQVNSKYFFLSLSLLFF